jgi:hypothetical protein
MGSTIKERSFSRNTQALAEERMHSRPKAVHPFTANKVSGSMFLIEGLVSLVGWLMDHNLVRSTERQN